MTTTTLGHSPFTRASYRGIDLYAPNRAPSRVDLSDNTNRHGMPPAAAAALRNLDPETVTRYPNLYAHTLKESLASYCGVPAGCVVTGCGSDDVLDSAIRAFAEPGDAIAFPSPTFPMIPIFAQMNGLRPIAVPYSAQFEIDVAGLLATRPKIIYICSPNNPTGTLTSTDCISRLLSESSALIIVDEAYIEYGGQSLAQLAVTSDQLLVTRTMSKAFGLAGLRVGYAIGSPGIVAEVEKSRGPYKVSTVAERCAVAALDSDMKWVEQRVVEDVVARERLFDELESLGLSPIRSQANFVLVPVRAAAEVALSMRQRGVAVRPFTALPVVGEALRISVGPWKMVRECLDALQASLEERA